MAGRDPFWTGLPARGCGVKRASGVTGPSVATSPCDFCLKGNCPNPFNSNSEIRFQISEYRYAKLALYDILGQEVVVLANEKKPPGSYSVRLEASSLASGVYFCRLTAGGCVQTHEMLLARYSCSSERIEGRATPHSCLLA